MTLTENERQERLHKRAGCVENAIEAMPDPTPEEKQARRALHCLYIAVDESIARDVQRDVEAWVRAAVAAEKEKLPAAWDAGFRHCLEWYGVWKDGAQRIGCQDTPIKDATPDKGRREFDLAAIRKGPK